jgi:hypothetical protein
LAFSSPSSSSGDEAEVVCSERRQRQARHRRPHSLLSGSSSGEEDEEEEEEEEEEDGEEEDGEDEEESDMDEHVHEHTFMGNMMAEMLSEGLGGIPLPSPGALLNIMAQLRGGALPLGAPPGASPADALAMMEQLMVGGGGGDMAQALQHTLGMIALAPIMPGAGLPGSLRGFIPPPSGHARARPASAQEVIAATDAAVAAEAATRGSASALAGLLLRSPQSLFAAYRADSTPPPCRGGGQQSAPSPAVAAVLRQRQYVTALVARVCGPFVSPDECLRLPCCAGASGTPAPPSAFKFAA